MQDQQERMKLQGAEFEAAHRFSQALLAHAATPIVDDDYPEVRHRYESALAKLLDAMKANERFAKGNRYGLVEPSDAATRDARELALWRSEIELALAEEAHPQARSVAAKLKSRVLMLLSGGDRMPATPQPSAPPLPRQEASFGSVTTPEHIRRGPQPSNAHDPAFPAKIPFPSTYGVEARDFAFFGGVTLRDWFAGKALEGIMANPERWKQIADDYISGRKTYEQCSEANAFKAYSLADAMIEERSRVFQ